MRRLLSCFLFSIILAGCNQDYYANTDLYVEETKIQVEYDCPTDSKTGFAGGDGSAGAPFEICYVGHLNSLRDKLSDSEKYEEYKDKYYKLTDNIDLGVSAEVFYPIGNLSEIALFGEELDCDEDEIIDDSDAPNCFPFEGDFDGNGKSILNMFIVDSNTSYIGLFQYLGANATVHDLNLNAVINMTGFAYFVGGIAGYSKGSISNINMGVSIIGSIGTNIGGLVGRQEGGEIENINIFGSVAYSGESSDLGGVAGLVQDGTELMDVSANVSVTGVNYVGGIVGTAKKNIIFDTILNQGTVKSIGEYSGGVVAFAEEGVSMSSLTNVGKIDSSGDHVGGIAGWLANADADELSCDAAEIYGDNYVGGLIGDAVDIQLTNSSSDCSFSTSGDYIGGFTGRIQEQSVISDAQVNFDITGAGRFIGAIAGFASSSTSITDINVDTNISASQYIGGVVGYSYEELYVNNAIVNSSNITGDYYVGGIAGYSRNDTFIENSTVTSSISGQDHVGGIVGYTVNSDVTVMMTDIFKANYIGSVTGKNFVAGIVGQAKDGIIIEDLQAAGPVSCTGFSCGGILGSVTNTIHEKEVNGETIKNSTSANIMNVNFDYDVNGNQMIGGILGSGDRNVYLTDVSALGNISALNGSVGGLVGRLTNSSSLIDSSFTGDVDGGTGSNVGGIVGDLSNSSILNISGLSNATVSGVGAVGGVVGSAYNGASVRQVEFIGTVIATGSPLGGLIGLANNITVRNASFRGSLLGDIANSFHVGGLIGVDSTSSPEISTLELSFAVTSTISGVNTDPILSTSGGQITNNNVYFDRTLAGVLTSSHGLGLDNSKMYQQFNYVGFDFIGMWKLPSPGIYPRLK